MKQIKIFIFAISAFLTISQSHATIYCLGEGLPHKSEQLLCVQCEFDAQTNTFSAACEPHHKSHIQCPGPAKDSEVFLDKDGQLHCVHLKATPHIHHHPKKKHI